MYYIYILLFKLDHMLSNAKNCSKYVVINLISI